LRDNIYGGRDQTAEVELEKVQGTIGITTQVELKRSRERW
jgi:hypothetical protein